MTHFSTQSNIKATQKSSALLISKKGLITLSSVLIFIFFIVPILRLVWQSFQYDGILSLKHYTTILSEPFTWNMLKNTAFIVVVSTILALVLGVTFAWIMAYTNFRGKKWIQIFIMLPFIIPSYIVTIAWTQFVKDLPITVNLYSLTGIAFLLGVSHFPLVYMFTVNVLKRIPKELEWAIRTSGGSRIKTFIVVTLPLSLPGIIGGGMIAFLSNLDNFGIPAFLGIPANITVLSTAIFQEVIGYGNNAFARAATLSVLLALIALIVTGLQWLLLRRSKVMETSYIDHTPRVDLGKWRSLVEIIVWALVLLFSIVPLISMLKTSFVKTYGVPLTLDTFTLYNYNFLLYDYNKVGDALQTSTILAIATAVICVVAGTIIAYMRIRKNTIFSKTLELIVAIPYTLPGMVLALAMILAWMQPIPGWNPGIYGSIWILLIAYVTRFMFLQVRGSSTAILQVSTDLEEAAHISGASVWAKWKAILLPLFLPGIISGSVLVILNTLTELTVSSLLWSSGAETIGVLIYNFEQAGYTTYSTAFSAIVLLYMSIFAGLLYGISAIIRRKRVSHDH
ncbi:ABC transporter permease [Solibacillus merdavium]|uniref:Iron ABC transporter permease n=1 Tax=Solibacillus merdavium TaxID=2762218 RepID=A0ABR8XSF5_9BACL|nr:iron ABC transporter permease [Solibacillus merdavium]MBD8034867.1 iron ABC transporter permease [Solibacillus merdavium]